MKLRMCLSLCVRLLFLISFSYAFTNPLLPGFNPDPSILKVDDTFYIATSTFEYYPGVPIYKSKDLVNWELVSHALNRPENDPLYGTAQNEGIWAPTLRHINGRFYMTTMLRWVYEPTYKTQARIFWTSSTDLINWTDLVWAEPWGIDPDLFVDPASGKTYLTLSSIQSEAEPYWGIYQCQVDLETGRCQSDYIQISPGTLPVTLATRPEGPHLYKIDKWYYLLLAEGGTGATHMATIQRGTSPSGPWEPCPWNPLVNNNKFGTNLTVCCTGHSDIVEANNGHWYAVFLGRRNINRVGHLGRETFLTEVTWEDEWPIYNNHGPILIESNITRLPTRQPVPSTYYDTFSSETLDLGWYHLRVPYTKNYALNPGSLEAPPLEFYPTTYNLTHRDNMSALLRRQKSMNMTFSVGVSVAGTAFKTELQEVGISLYGNEGSHQDIALARCTNSTGGYCVKTSINKKGIFTRTSTPLSGSPSQLSFHIRAEPQKYGFGYSTSAVSANTTAAFVNWLASIENTAIATNFAGLHFAVYATGNGRPWPYDETRPGFKWVKEEYYEEHIPDYDVWT